MKESFSENHTAQWLHPPVIQISIPSNTMLAEQQQRVWL
jgi:hypothetical protein